MAKEFNANMLREKFIITDNSVDDSLSAPVIAMSNRFVIPLRDYSGKVIETFIVRAQNMHCCVRMASKIYQTYEKEGPILNRDNKFNWSEAWEDTIKEYERRYNKDCWIAVYNKGKIIYQSKEHHIFLDMIEKFQEENKGEYGNAVKISKKAFLKAGKNVEIQYDSGVALVIHEANNICRCGVIIRSASKTTTFNYTLSSKESKKTEIANGLYLASNFLEAIQLAFMIGTINGKLSKGKIKKTSKEYKKNITAQDRLQIIKDEISSFENLFNIKYRPEKPDFDLIIKDAQSNATTLYDLSS